MPVREDSWYARSAVVQEVNASGEPSSPAWVDLVPRLVSYEFLGNRKATLDASDTWAVVALVTLKDAKAWKFIAEMSGVVDPFTEGEPGRIVTIPTEAVYRFDLQGPVR